MIIKWLPLPAFLVFAVTLSSYASNNIEDCDIRDERLSRKRKLPPTPSLQEQVSPQNDLGYLAQSLVGLQTESLNLEDSVTQDFLRKRAKSSANQTDLVPIKREPNSPEAPQPTTNASQPLMPRTQIENTSTSIAHNSSIPQAPLIEHLQRQLEPSADVPPATHLLSFSLPPIPPYSSSFLPTREALASGVPSAEAVNNLSVQRYQRARQAQDYARLGSGLAMQNVLNEAIENFTKALDIEELQGVVRAKCLFNLGAALFKQGAINEAIENFTKALEIEEYQGALRAGCLFNLGRVLVRRGAIIEAIESYTKALSIKEYQGISRAECFYYRGDAYFKLKELQKAYLDYDRTLNFLLLNKEGSPFKGSCLYRIGNYFREIKQYEVAVQKYTEALGEVCQGKLRAECLYYRALACTHLEGGEALVLKDMEAALALLECSPELQRAIQEWKTTYRSQAH